MSGIEIGGSIIGIFPVVIKALGAYQDSVDVLRLLDDRNFQNEIQAIILEMEIQEVIYRNTYMSLLALFMPPRSVLRLFMSPNGLSQHSGLVTDHLKKHLGPDWKLYMRLLEQLRYSLKMLEANITAIAAMLKPIQFTYTARRRRGLLYQIKENNTAMRILVEQKGSMQSMELVQKHDNVDAPWLFLREKTRHLADLTVSQFDCVTQQYTHSMGIYLDFYRYLTSIGMMYGGVRSGFGSNKEKRIVFKGQTLAWTSKHYAQKKLFMVLFRSVSLVTMDRSAVAKPQGSFIPLENDDINQSALYEPYLKACILAKNDALKQPSNPPALTSIFGIKSRNLYNLGIMLLELLLNQALAAFRTPEKPSETDDEIA